MRAPERLGPYTCASRRGLLPLGEDSLALAGFATVKRGWRVCDLGCGRGALLLLLLAGRESTLDCPGWNLPRRRPGGPPDNLAENGLSGEICTGDWRAVNPSRRAPLTW